MTDAWRRFLPPSAMRLISGLVLISGALLSSVALADGSHVALHATSGGYAITLFAARVPVVAGRCDLSLLVQDAQTGAVIADASGTAALSVRNRPPRAFSFAHISGGSSFLVMTADLAPGEYTLNLTVYRVARPVANASGVLTVAADPGRRITLLYGLGTPCVVILLFLVNQHAKLKRVRRKGV